MKIRELKTHYLAHNQMITKIQQTFKTFFTIKMKTFTLLLLFLIISVKSGFSQALPIYIDGIYNDWETAIHSYEDNLDDGQEFDFAKFTVTNDNDFLFIKIEFSEEINLTDNNNIYLNIDTDNNPNTGWDVNGIGAELTWNFGQRNGYFNINGSYETIYHSDIQLRLLPTVTSNIFEIAIGRNVKPNGNDELFTGSTIKICFTDDASNGDEIPNSGEFFTYIFDATNVPAMEPILIPKENENFIRFMTYNIRADFDNNIGGLNDPNRIPKLSRIFAAISPDIITINEAWYTSTSEASDFLNTYLPLENDKEWYVNKLDGANITASRFPITTSKIVYSGNSITANLIDLSEKELNNVMVISAHLKCCDYDDRRQEQADAIAAFILDCKTTGGVIDLPENTPFILMGDLNLVGLSQQLTTLVTGDIQNTDIFGQPAPLDWDDSDLTDLISYQTDKRMAYTWRNDYGSYLPSRLDFMIYSDHVLTLEKTFVIQTEIMPQQRLDLYGLQQYDTRNSSDHFPKVADFTIPILIIDTVPKLNITNPTEDEILFANSSYSITWTNYLIDKINISYFNQSDNSLIPIAEQISASNHSFDWTIPNNHNITDKFKIIISDVNNSISDTSEYFVIYNNENIYSIFPNPNTGILNIIFEDEAELKNLKIIDLNGNTIFNQTLSNEFQQQIDLTKLGKGTYIMKIKIDEMIYYEKLIIN